MTRSDNLHDGSSWPRLGHEYCGVHSPGLDVPGPVVLGPDGGHEGLGPRLRHQRHHAASYWSIILMLSSYWSRLTPASPRQSGAECPVSLRQGGDGIQP